MIKRKNTKKNRKYKLKKTQKGGAAAALLAVQNPGATLKLFQASSALQNVGQGSAKGLAGLAQVIRSKVPMSSQFTNVVKAAKLGNLGNLTKLASTIKKSTMASNGLSKLKSLISASTSSPLKQQGLATPSPLKQQGLATSSPLKQQGSIPFSIGRPQTPLPFKSAAAQGAPPPLKFKSRFKP